jgi:hypothetical protein
MVLHVVIGKRPQFKKDENMHRMTASFLSELSENNHRAGWQ